MRSQSLFFLFICIWFACSCGTTQKSQYNNQKPSWITSRPTDPNWYTGIGIAKKWGSPANYQSDAREKALADMAAQINSQVSSTSVLYQVEDKKGVSEMLASQIKSSSKEYLEGYEQVDVYEDEQYYYSFFRLSKIRYQELKTIRKNKALDNALLKYNEAFLQQKEGHIASSLNLYADCLEAISDYLGEENSVVIEGRNVDLAIESIQQIKSQVALLQVFSPNKAIVTSSGQMINSDKLLFVVKNHQGMVQVNIPVRFTYSGGYLRKDADISTSEGKVGTTIHQISSNSSAQTLCAAIDVVNLLRNMTSNLLIRKLIEGTAGHSDCIHLEVK